MASIPLPIEVTLTNEPRALTTPTPPEPEIGSEDGSAAPLASAAVPTQNAPTSAEPTAAPMSTRPAAIRPPVQPELIAEVPAPMTMASVSEAELVGALKAGSSGGPGAGLTGNSGPGAGSGGGGSCDMVARLQSKLREDDDIRRTVADVQRSVGGRALLVWDGDWRQNPGQAGKGLAGVRQAIALEVAFAPAACRSQTMRGLVLVTLSDGPGGARVAWGTGR